MLIRDYIPPPTLERFMLDLSVFRSVIGPFGPGKSTACAFEIMRQAQLMPKSIIDGVRRSRVLIVPNTKHTQHLSLIHI